MAFTTYLQHKVLDYVLGTTAYTAPTTVYIGLFTTATGIGGTGTEVSGGGYARKAMTFDSAASGTADNAAIVEFDEATSSWGTVTHTAVFDALTVGNMLMEDELATSKTIASGDIFRFQAGDFDVTLT